MVLDVRLDVWPGLPATGSALGWPAAFKTSQPYMAFTVMTHGVMAHTIMAYMVMASQ